MQTQWEMAVKKGDVTAVLSLLSQGADVNARDRFAQTALMLASHAGHREVVATLMEHGADLNVTAKYGLSALMLSIIADYQDVAKLLAGAGGDLTLRGSGAPGFAGKTAYDLAVDRGMNELAAALKPTGDS